jgi:hypothetical protein
LAGPYKLSIDEGVFGLVAYITAARRHAGGVAATKLARAAMATKTKLVGYMVSWYYFGKIEKSCMCLIENTVDRETIVFE